MTDYASRFALLTDEQRNALRARLQTVDKSQPGPSASSMSTAGERLLETCLPCSSAQSRLWFLEQWQPGTGLYHIGNAVHLRGPLDLSALQASLDGLVARHEGLRTGFIEEGGEPWQRILSVARCALTVEDLGELEGSAQEEMLRERLAAEAARPFELREPPLLRAAVWRLGVEAHALLLVVHHIVSDGWSQGVLKRELSVLYGAAVRGETAVLPALPVQYADYALWQRETLSGTRLATALAYWRTQLSELPVLALPTDRPRPLQPSYTGSLTRFALAPELVTGLRRLAREAGGTLYMVLLAAFKVLLMRYSGQADVVVGSPIAGRDRVELEGLIGFFVNTLVLRTRVAGELSFRAVLERVRETALGAYEHAEVPFEKLVAELRPVRDLSRSPLFQVMFVLQNTPGAELGLVGLAVTELQVGRTTSKFDLSLSLVERDGGLSGVLEYATDLYEAATMERLGGHYRTLLEGVVVAPEARVSELPLLTAAERAQVLGDWNATAVGYPREATLSSLFEAQVSRTPAAVALVCGDVTLSYTELNTRANRLAHWLRSVGVGPEVLVGLYMSRSVDLVVGLLGILKAGGAYVPLDPTYPPARVAYMLADTAAPVVLTETALQADLSAYAGRTLCLDTDWAGRVADQPVHNPRQTATADSLAYVIYTSGSTGQPKGVMVSQRNVARLVCGTDYASFSATETFLLLAPIAFDASTFELWGALLNGARCVIYSEEAPTASGLERVIARHGITTLWLTAALFNAIIDERPEVLRGVRQLLTGGEALSAPHVRRAQVALPEVQLINGYGPTESTTFTCCYRIPELAAACIGVPIGRPIANTEVYLLDEAQQPVPVGVEGELYIGGDGLARGYLGRPDLTAEKFIAHPFSAAPGARLYRTGDRARYLADGNLEFMGRVDHQVKLRGFRIELGEIEAVLLSQPGVRQVVVLLREDRPGDKRLVAYVVGQNLDTALLRAQLKQTLPEYMMPSAWVVLGFLPLTANGKVDRAALLPPDSSVLASGAGGSPPRDVLERHLVGIWESLFDRAWIHIDQDFLALGGHSLLALRLVGAIANTFGTRLPLDTLWFRGSTIRGIAELLRGQTGCSPWPMLMPIKPGRSKPALFCVHTIGGNLFHYFDLAKALSVAQPVMGLQARGVDGIETPRSKVADIAADCIAAMRAMQPHGPYHLAGFSSGGIVAFEMAQQLLAGGESVGLLALLDTYAPGVYRRAPSGRLLDRLARAVRPYMNRMRLAHAVHRLVGATPRHGFPDLGSAHWWAHWGYRPSAYPGQVDLYLAEESRSEASEPCLGWTRLAAGGLEIHQIPGSHGLMVKPPLVQILAESLQRRLDEVVIVTV